MNTDSGLTSLEEPPVEEPGEQAVFSDPDASRETAWRSWMMGGLGIIALLSVVSVIVAVSALATRNPSNTVIAGQPGGGTMAGHMASGMAMGQPAGSGATAAGKPESVKLVVKSDTEHGRRGPDGKWHDSFLPGDFTVHAGDTVTVTVYNYDTMMHSFTSSSLSSAQLINQMIPSGSAGSPSQTTFKFTAPSKPGKYAWWCAVPCDPWAMAHDGFMRGYVTVAA